MRPDADGPGTVQPPCHPRADVLRLAKLSAALDHPKLVFAGREVLLGLASREHDFDRPLLSLSDRAPAIRSPERLVCVVLNQVEAGEMPCVVPVGPARIGRSGRQASDKRTGLGG
jgi:hypothetical protein